MKRIAWSRRAGGLALLVTAACAAKGTPAPSSEVAPAEVAPAPAAPADAAPATARSPAAPADAAGLAGAELAAVCTQYQAALRALGGPDHPPGFPDEAILGPWRVDGAPVRAGSAAIPRAHQTLVDDPVTLGAGAAPRAPRSPVYVAASAAQPAADLRALRARLPRGAELRVLVRKPGAEVVAQHAAMFPRTPPALQARLPELDTIDAAAPDLVRLALPCRPVLAAFRTVAEGATLDTLGPATATALAACDCKLADLDGYVGLLTYLLLPLPHFGYVVVDGARLARLPATATVADAVTTP
jgi:hypothetical protein